MTCTVIIDGSEIKTTCNSNLLQTALDNGIYIPNLCYIKNNERQFASCRLCFVEIDGKPEPVTACTEHVVDGMVIRVNSPRAVALRRTAFELLLSNHQLECGRCPKNRRCELQQIARFNHLKLRSPVLTRINESKPVDDSHPHFRFNPNKCVLCGRCVVVCHKEGTGVLDFAHRGIRARVSTFMDIPLAETECNSCLACVDVCPVGALYRKIMEIKV